MAVVVTLGLISTTVKLVVLYCCIMLFECLGEYI
jgi:hypothetical protein